MKLCIAVHLCFCTALPAAALRNTLSGKVSAKFKCSANQKKELVEPGDVMTLFGARSTMECSVRCLDQDICMSFNACQDSLGDYPVRCELFKRRGNHTSLRSSPKCSYFERESPCQNGGEYLDAEDRCKCAESYAGLTCQRIMRAVKVLHRWIFQCVSYCGAEHPDCSDGYIDRVWAWEYFLIQPEDSPEPFQVFCNNRAVGGMTYAMYRARWQTPYPDFYRDWQTYKEGFGTHYNNFWIGNERLHQITKQGVYELEVGVQRYSDAFKSAYYEQISVGSENERYALHLGSYRGGTLGGDSLTPSNDPQRNINGKPFSTFDNDVSNNCSAQMQAGWWFAELCTSANLNGPMVLSGFPRMSWSYPFGNDVIANAYMQIRKKSYYTELP